MIDQFNNPGPEWRGKPFWSWNGKLEKTELVRQIDVMKEMGLGGFFMHSRTGLETEYLGDEWFELINACADYGEKLGMEAWLYDEDRWPSGLAGGIVSKNPEYRQKAILLEINPEGEGDQVIAEFSCDLDGAVCTNLGTGGARLRFSIVEQGRSGFYNGYTYIDTLNRDATDAFLECTHEKYAAKCGDRLGGSIKGIFTDEPHRGALLSGFSMYREDGGFCLPYTQKLFEEFEKRFGYDLKAKLPELFLQVDGKRISPVKWRYVELLQQLFLENYAIPCREWCETHGLIVTGHVLHEDNLTSQTAMSGSVMRYYEHMTAPGVDVLTEGNRNYWVVKQLASAARQTGKTQLLSELYGCTGWQMPFAGHKNVGDWQALLGINLRCHHLSWYTMRGEAKRDYPASILHQSAWYPEYSHVEDYFARFGLMMAQGEPVCDVLVVNPVESLWAQVRLGWCSNLDLEDEHLKTLEESYQQLFTWLLESQVDFDYGDEEMLARLGSVDCGVLRVGSATYTTVVIAGMDTIRSTTLELLKQFVDNGGKVVAAGEAPAYVDCERPTSNIEHRTSNEESYFDFGSSLYCRVPFEKETILAELPERLAAVDAPDIFGQLRRTDDGGLIFAALNVDRESRREGATVRIKAELPIEEWNCETGERMPVAASLVDGVQTFTTDFMVGGMKLFVASATGEERPTLNIQRPTSNEKKTIEGPFEYTLSEPNVCVLDLAEYKIGEGEWEGPAEALKIDQRVRDTHGVMRRGGEMLQPWFVAQHPVKDLCDVGLRFSFDIEAMPEWVDLVIEEPESFTVEVNGELLNPAWRSGEWVDITFHRGRIPQEQLCKGANEIVLRTRYTGNSSLEAIYLLGEFGVRLDGVQRSLVPLAKQVEVGDLCAQGLPFYSGRIIYEVPVPENSTRLELPGIGAACAVVNDQALGWDPFEADISDCGARVDVELVLTRRNTFGPLHDPIPNRPYVAPDSFVTEGDEFTSECVFVETGLLVAPLCG